MIKKLVLKNWQSHLESVFEFGSGVNGILGVMGSGKSSVLNAICFAFYGTYPSLSGKKKKIDEVIMNVPNQMSEASVELMFDIGDCSYSVKRVIRLGRGTIVNELRRDGKLIEGSNSQRVSESVEDVIKVDYNLFVQVIYCEQNRIDMFLQIPRGQRMQRIDELLKIKKFETVRSNTIKLRNRIAREIEKRREDILKLEKSLEETDRRKIVSEMKKLENEIGLLSMDIEKLKNGREKVRGIVEVLRKKEKIDKALGRKKIEYESKIKQIDEEICGFGEKESIDKHSREFALSQCEKLKGFADEQKKMQRDFVKLGERGKFCDESIVKLSSEKEQLDGKKGMSEKVAYCRKKIDDLGKDISEKAESISGFAAKKEIELKSVEELKGAGSSCPVCESKIDEKRRKDILKMKTSKIEAIERRIKSLEKDVADLREKLADEKKFYDDNVRYVNVAEDIKVKNKELSAMLSEKNRIKKSVGEISAKYSEEKIRKIESEIRRFEKVVDMITMSEKKVSLSEDLKQIGIELRELGFDEKVLRGAESEFSDIDKKYEVTKERVESAKNVYVEKKRLADNIEKQEKIVDDYRNEVKLSERKVTELTKFSLVLEETQIILREEFVESINYTMSDFWKVLYPYKDYLDIQLFIEKDYVLKLLNRSGNWVNVESNVSGGERMSAVIVLRLAFVVVLAPNLGLLLLDEPTHNLDAKAIDELADTFRDKISSLISQTILITHEEKLESAVNSEIYRLDRGDDKEEVTSVV